MHEFIDAILQSSNYPETYPVSSEFEYDAESREVTVSVQVPAPAEMWTLKSTKWVRSAGEIRETRSSQAEQRRRYNTTVAAVALRTMSELFRAEPSEIIETISLTVFTKTDDPATGQQKSFRFVEVAADREQFPQYNLEKVEAADALEHMHAAVSKNAFALKAVSTALLSGRDEACAGERAMHRRCHRAGNGSCSAGSGTRLTARSRSCRPAF
ncbi:MAG: hypothetical protein WA290_08505 [Mycobacterium sp.]